MGRVLRLKSRVAACMVVLTVVSAESAMAQVEVFPVNRDVGINGYPGEEYTNTGASPTVRGAKYRQHAALFDWDTEAIKVFLAANPGQVSATFSIYPLGTPDTDVTVQTVESLEDWVEGDGAGGCCQIFSWTEGTPAVTHFYAQTFYLPGPVEDPDQSVPWLNDEDGSQYGFMNTGPGGGALPNFINSTPLELASWEVGTFISVPLDEDLFTDLLENENNRGLRLAAPTSGSNWMVSMKEQAGGAEAAFLEVTVIPQPTVTTFVRGDPDSDGAVNITDGIVILTFLFLGGAQLSCQDAADTDNSGAIDLSDAVALFNYQFLGGNAPPPPGPLECGRDSGPEDQLTCVTFPRCR